MRKKLIFTVLIVLFLVIIYNLTRQVLMTSQSGKRLEEAKKRFENLTKENQELKKQKEWFSSNEFIEEEARNKLNLSRAGETVVVLPKEVLGIEDQEKTEEKNLPNWKKWMKIFIDEI